jgi:uncharacterized membrane protein
MYKREKYTKILRIGALIIAIIFILGIILDSIGLFG